MDARTVDPHRLYWESVLAGKYDLRGTGFPDLPLSWNQWMYRQMRSSVDRLLKRNDLGSGVSKASVLDIGSGVGHWLQYWSNHGVAALQGSDLTATAVGELQQRFPEVPVTQVDIGMPNPPFEGRFDLISVMAVLQHIADDQRWRQALINVGDLLADDGVGVIIDPLLAQVSGSTRSPKVACRGPEAKLSGMTLSATRAWSSSIGSRRCSRWRLGATRRIERRVRPGAGTGGWSRR
jgi:2-polyprenyl-3-methyl-5-hydroxy-6-metoxy-1,4-benzoquinol methylase